MEDNLQGEEWSIITENLMPEFRQRFTAWNKEYASQRRDLGARAEFVNFWRKAKRIKAVVWDGISDNSWREGVRTVLFECIGHLFLMIFDLDKEIEARNNPMIGMAPEEKAEHAAARLQALRPGEGLPSPLPKPLLFVPECGHRRCVMHHKIPFASLSSEAKGRFDRDEEPAGHGITG